MKIGVYDSGIGGERIAKLLQLEFKDIEIINVSDKENLPYGNKTKKQLIKLVIPKILKMELEGCDIIVIACNTVTTNLITEIRESVNVPVIGFEPMIKPATKISKSGIVAVCATPTTLSSVRYDNLKKDYAKNINVLEPDCSNWASLIESNQIDKNHITKIVDTIVKAGADVVVLGCTHYHWIETIIYDNLPKDVIILQPEDAILKRINTIIVQENLEKT